MSYAKNIPKIDKFEKKEREKMAENKEEQLKDRDEIRGEERKESKIQKIK